MHFWVALITGNVFLISFRSYYKTWVLWVVDLDLTTCIVVLLSPWHCSDDDMEDREKKDVYEEKGVDEERGLRKLIDSEDEESEEEEDKKSEKAEEEEEDGKAKKEKKKDDGESSAKCKQEAHGPHHSPEKTVQINKNI